jgi:hypothetical protein
MKNFTSIFALLIFFALFAPKTCLAQIVNIEERRITGTNDTTDWYGFFRLGASLTRVQDDIMQFNSTGQIQYKHNRSLTLLLLDARFLRAGEQDFNRVGFAHLRYNYKISDPLVFEAYGQAQYNKLLLIKLRALTGSGLRYRWLKSSDGQQRIYSGLAALFEHNQFLQELGEQNWWRLSSYVSFTFYPWEGVKFVGTTYFQPQVDDWENYRLSSEWRLDMPLGKKLSFTTDFTYSVDQSLPADAPTSTFSWINSFTFRF